MSTVEQFRNILSPIAIGPVTLKNRIVMAPISHHMSTEAYTEREAAFNLARAKGGVGMIIVGATWVHPSGRGGEDLGFNTDDNIPAFKAYNDEMHQYGAKSSIQLYHLGRYASGASGSPPVAPSPIPWPPGNVTPHELTVPEIQELVEAWGQAAARAKKAGFDMVEIHHAHGYLTAQFMSPHANQRTDDYGGSFNNRFRFLKEVFECCRRAVGEDFPIHVRLSNAEYVDGGLVVEDQIETAKRLESLGAAFISVSSGLSPCWGHTRTLPSMVHEPGLNVQDAAKIKAAVGIPVMVTGRLSDYDLAEKVLAEGQADLIGMARGLICDPEWVNKLAEDRAATIRPCISCNNCHNRELTDRTTRCLYNVEAGRELNPAITPAKAAKKVVIAGGGPAGMEAARVAALRGHEVILFEETARLGGNLALAAVPPHKHEYATAVDFCAKELDRLGVEVRLNTALTRAEVEAEKPEAVLVAAGAEVRFPPIDGLDTGAVVSATRVLSGEAEVGARALVVGGGPVGAETAHYLAAEGREVVLVEMLPEIVPDMLPDFRWFLFQAFEELGVRVRTETTVKGIDGRKVILESVSDGTVEEDVDTVVIGTGMSPRNDLSRDLEGCGADVLVIGDAAEPRDGVKAFVDGYMAGYNL